MATINIDFLPIFPKEYDPYNDQLVQYSSILPNKSRDEKFIMHVPMGSDDIDVLIAKGINRFTKGNLFNLGEAETNVRIPDGLSYDDVPTAPILFGKSDVLGYDDWVDANGPSTNWPFIWNRRYYLTPPGATEPMTYEEGRNKGNQYGTHNALYIFETEEQSHALSYTWSCVKGWSETWHARINQTWGGTGKLILTAWNYFRDMGVNTGTGTPTDRKNLFRSPLSAWPSNPMLPGGNLELFTAYCVPMYFRSPNAGFGIGYNLALQYYVQKKTGKNCIVFPAHRNENNPNGITEWRMTEGKYYHRQKLPQDASLMLMAGALGRVFCKGIVPWGFGGRDTRPFRVNKYNIDQGWESPGLWVPDGNGETETADVNTSPALAYSDQVEPANGVLDNLLFGKYLADRTFGITEGGVDEWLRYRVDGGSWYEPVNDWADDAINADTNSAPLVFSRRKDGVISFLVCDPSADDCDAHTVEFEFGANTYVAEIAGRAPFMVNTTY